MKSVDPAPVGWPRSARAVASALILMHLLGLLGLVLSNTSGPWVTPDGEGIAHEPYFARQIYDRYRSYLYALKLDENYQFVSNLRPEAARRIRINVTKTDGTKESTVEPAPGSWPARRHHWNLLASVVAAYNEVTTPEGERIPPPGQAAPTAQYWRRNESGTAAGLVTVPEHLLPRNEALVAPTPFAKITADSIERHAKRSFGGQDAEVVLIRKPYFGAVVVMADRPELLEDGLADFDAVEFSFRSGN